MNSKWNSSILKNKKQQEKLTIEEIEVFKKKRKLPEKHNIEKYGDCYCNVTFIQWMKVQIYIIILDKKPIKPLI